MKKNAKDAVCVWIRVLQNVLNSRLSSASTVCIRRNIPARAAPAAAPVIYCCPEPGAITVERMTPPPKTVAAVSPQQEVANAPAV